MATITKVAHPSQANDKHAVGDVWLVHGTYQFDSSYPTNGEVLAASDFGDFTTILDFFPFASGAEVPVFDKANLKVKLFLSDGLEATNASDQSAVTVRYFALLV